MFVCWLWRGNNFPSERVKYGAEHVNVLGSMLRRHGGHHLACCTNMPDDIDPRIQIITMPAAIAALPRFFPKLWGFSAEFGARISQRFASIDLDAVVLGDLGPLLDAKGAFRIWNRANGELYNSSFYVLNPGARTQVWNLFSPTKAVHAEREWRKRGLRWTGDQSWIGWICGHEEYVFTQDDGIYIYRPSKHREAPPLGALAMFFCGNEMDPAVEVKHSDWLREAWR